MWRTIPSNILNDIKTLNNYTSQNEKESTLTVCRNNSKVFTANATGGEDGSVESLSCDSRFGENTRRVADIHTHPYNEYSVGLLPSQADMAVNLSESKKANSKQTSCISNANSPYIVCHEPKRVPTTSKVNQYIDHEVDTPQFYKSRFHTKNVRHDFETAYFDPNTGNRVEKPDGDQVLQTMFGASVDTMKTHELHRGNKKQICRYVNSVSGQNVRNKCAKMLSNKQTV